MARVVSLLVVNQPQGWADPLMQRRRAVRLDSETAKEMMNEWENVSERVRFFPSHQELHKLTC